MVQRYGKPPAVGSTDWAAREILRLLDREELEKAEAQRLKRSGWAPSEGQLPAVSPDRYGRFGDARDAVVDLVQADLDRRHAFRDEAQRRVARQMAQVPPSAPFAPPRKPEELGNQPTSLPLPPQKPVDTNRTAIEGLPYAPMGPGRNVSEAGRQAFRDALDSRGGLSPTMRAIFDYVFDFEGGYKPDKSEQTLAPDRYPVTGIRPETLQRYQELFYEANPEVRSATGAKYYNPGELNDQQRISIMKWLADTQMGKFDLDEIATPSAPGATGDPKLAGLLFDTYYRRGQGDATRAVQRALDTTLKGYRSDLIAAGINPDEMDVPKTVGTDGIPGSQTRDALMLLLNAGRSDLLRAAIDAEANKLQGGGGANDVYRRGVFQ
ncbi:MAG: hypothetical protein ACKV2U_34405 [Bryobacteraceae bacterium]